jgi:hypothetical protein
VTKAWACAPHPAPLLPSCPGRPPGANSAALAHRTVRRPFGHVTAAQRMAVVRSIALAGMSGPEA